jgi:hypothetical protein
MFQVVKLGGIAETTLNNIGYKFKTFIHYRYRFMLVEIYGFVKNLQKQVVDLSSSQKTPKLKKKSSETESGKSRY